jgi:hypothetical protein
MMLACAEHVGSASIVEAVSEIGLAWYRQVLRIVRNLDHRIGCQRDCAECYLDTCWDC